MVYTTEGWRRNFAMATSINFSTVLFSLSEIMVPRFGVANQAEWDAASFPLQKKNSLLKVLAGANWLGPHSDEAIGGVGWRRPLEAGDHVPFRSEFFFIP